MGRARGWRRSGRGIMKSGRTGFRRLLPFRASSSRSEWRPVNSLFDGTRKPHATKHGKKLVNLTLQNQRALVTGGSRGIGAAIVKRLAREGAHVALTYVSKPDQANETAKVVRALGVKAVVIQADSADPRAVVAAIERTVSELGGIDILVNNAGIA